MNWALQTKLAIVTLLLLSRRGGLSLHELATALGQDPQGLTHLLSKLEAQRWINQEDPDEIRITAEPGGVSLYQVMEAVADPSSDQEENPRVTRLHQRLEDLDRAYFSDVTLEEMLRV